MKTYKEEYQHWLDSPALGENEWRELSEIAEDDREIESRFFAPLEFGTAGLRGIMGMGLRRMNVHIIRWATQAFAELIKSEGKEACTRGVCICYDCRNHSEEFAREAASVMAANGVFVRLFDAMRPTPELSYAIIRYGAAAGINVTASHNPKEYNGYKVYWSDGAQLPPQHAAAIAANMEKLDVFRGVTRMPFEDALAEGKIEFIGAETDEAFLNESAAMSINPDVVKSVADDFRVVYTPFHGAGHKLVPEALRRLGVKHLFCEPQQMIVDGNFPTVISPNPEDPEGFYLAIEHAKEHDADIIIGTDPDSDRVGILAKTRAGQYEIVSGNRTGILLLDYIIKARKEKGRMPEHPAFIKTIVTTRMGAEIAKKHGVHVEETFTGFKYMAEKLAEYKVDGAPYQYLMAYEESFGYMMGDFVRDKDAVTASALLAEMAAYHFSRGKNLFEALEELFEEYGYYDELTLNLVMPGLDGLAKMKALMDGLREKPPAEIAGVVALRMRDYESGDISVAELGVVGKTAINGSNVLYFELEDGTDFIVRPSGTEPKIKVYILAKGSTAEDCAVKIAKYAAFAEALKE